MSWVKYAKPGDKVVCIKRRGWREVGPGEMVATAFPIFGGVYTIEYIIVEDETVFLKLAEIVGGFFASVQFKPLETRPSDISIFTDMLNTAPERVKEDA